MSSRTYLSIGDVLTLLREEFPDVTISKIRFLESQGLVNPERSPSGYRKFFDHDVERLRWVLRQQREHFLPLKVIRDRLADGDLDDGPSGGAAAADAADVGAAADAADVGAATAERTRDKAEDTNDNGKTSEPPRTAAAGAAGVTGSAQSSLEVAGETRGKSPGKAPEKSGEPSGVGERSSKEDDAMSRILADASRRSARRPDTAPAGSSAAHDAGITPESAPTVGEPDGGQLLETGPGVRNPTPARSRRVGVSEATVPIGDRSGTPGTPGGPAPATAPGTGRTASSEGRGRRGADARTSQRKTPTTGTGVGDGEEEVTATAGTPSLSRTAPSLPETVVTGASLTAEELCTASGLSAAELAELEGYGLLQVVSVAGMRTYDENALTVANLAASFRAFGIEPRHLRLYRNAADREMGLVEQVVIPLLRQRNPESRQRAIEAAEQLAALGQSMRASLVRTELRRHLGG